MAQGKLTVATSRRHSQIKKGVGLVVAPLLCTTPFHCASDLDGERKRSSLLLTTPHPRTSRQGQDTLTVATSRRHGQKRGIENEVGSNDAHPLLCTTANPPFSLLQGN